jgi:Sodium:sulfate symporter transmembrane region
MEMETREREERREGRFPREGDGGDGLQRRTYRTLDEQEGRLSEAEQRFERRRRTVGLFLGPIVVAVMLLIPFDLDGNQHRLAAILAFVIVWWLTEAIPIPVTALLGVVLCALLEATPPPPEGDSSVDVVFGRFTDDTIFLFIGSFIIAQSLSGVVCIASARWCTGCTEGSPSACSACVQWAARPSASSWRSG